VIILTGYHRFTDFNKVVLRNSGRGGGATTAIWPAPNGNASGRERCGATGIAASAAAAKVAGAIRCRPIT